MNKVITICFVCLLPFIVCAQQPDFPGKVAPYEKRLMNRKVKFDLDYTTYGIKLRPQPRPWISTGLYAAPGEKITVDVPPELAGKIKVRIGIHTDNIGRLKKKGRKIKRELVVTKLFDVVAGKNILENEFGGHLIVQLGEPEKGSGQITVSGAVKSPDYILGKTNVKAWRKEVAASGVPWAELRGKRVILSLPVDELRTLEDPEALMLFWDRFITESYDGWWGVTPDDPEPRFRPGNLPWRFVTDIQPSAGSAHSGYPIVCMLFWGNRMIDLEKMQSVEWGVYHELGHNYQQPWSWRALGEVSCNFNVFHVLAKLGKSPVRMQKRDWIDRALVFAAMEKKDKSLGELGLFERIVPFMQLVQNYGWGLYTFVTRQVYETGAELKSDQEKIDFFAEKASVYAQCDLTPFFTAWGIPVSAPVKLKLSHYPRAGREIWCEFSTETEAMQNF